MTGADVVCAWCGLAMPAGIRSDAICCSKRCRQARHRFTTGVGVASPISDGQPRRLAYADPPYPGLSARYYGDHPDYAGEVDHAELIERLSAEYDAWALSTNASSLQLVLGLCPPGVRVGAWHRGERPHQTATGPLSAWEPVIYGGEFRRAVRPLDATRRVEQLVTRRADPRDASSVDERRVVSDVEASLEYSATRRDLLEDASRHDRHATRQRSSSDVSRGDDEPLSVASGSQRDVSALQVRRVDSLVYKPGVRTTDPNRVVGAKPAVFCRWVFELLGAQVGDTFVDVFPGSGGVARAWDVYMSCSTVVGAERMSS